MQLLVDARSVPECLTCLSLRPLANSTAWLTIIAAECVLPHSTPRSHALTRRSSHALSPRSAPRVCCNPLFPLSCCSPVQRTELAAEGMTAARHVDVSHLQCLSLPPRSLSLPGWRYELHLYLDYGFPVPVLPSVVSALHSSFPFFRLTHSQLSPLQHLSLLLSCWEQTRWQLNGLGVLDVLEQQWDADRRVSATAPVEALVAPLSSTELHRKRRRASGRGADDSDARQLPASDKVDKQRLWQREELAGQAVSRRVAVIDDGGIKREIAESRQPEAASSKQFPLSQRPSTYRRAEYVTAARYSSTATRVEHSTDQRALIVPPLSLKLLLGSGVHEFVSELRQSNIDHSGRTVRYSLFLTEYDCYVPGLTFVFGVARLTRCALVSMHRLESRCPAATAAFLAKECVHEVGHLFSLLHCSPPCVMSYSSTVEEALEKDAHLCESCVVKLQWMQRGVIIKPSKHQQPPLGSVEAAAEAVAARASYR